MVARIDVVGVHSGSRPTPTVSKGRAARDCTVEEVSGTVVRT